MMAFFSFKTLLSVYQTTRRHIQEDRNLHCHRIEDSKYYIETEEFVAADKKS
jgi:hypothetical protein